MNVFDEYEKFEFDPNSENIFGLKSGILWASQKGRSPQMPLLYIQSSNNLTEDQFRELLDKLEINVRN